MSQDSRMASAWRDVVFQTLSAQCTCQPLETVSALESTLAICLTPAFQNGLGSVCDTKMRQFFLSSLSVHNEPGCDAGSLGDEPDRGDESVAACVVESGLCELLLPWEVSRLQTDRQAYMCDSSWVMYCSDWYLSWLCWSIALGVPLNCIREQCSFNNK